MDISDLTVIVPTRNERQNIPAFLASLPIKVELIVVDASDDDTPDLIMQLRPTLTQVIRHPARITEARQIGARASHTEWLLFTDADIVFDADYFAYLAHYTTYDALYGPKLSKDYYRWYYTWFSGSQAFADRLGIPAASGSNLLVRRDVFWAIGGFDLQLSCNEDSELAWRIKRQGYRIVFSPELAVFARDHRRLERGLIRKTLHSLVRCGLLFSGLMPRRWRGRDWGYWKHLPQNVVTHDNTPWENTVS